MYLASLAADRFFDKSTFNEANGSPVADFKAVAMGFLGPSSSYVRHLYRMRTEQFREAFAPPTGSTAASCVTLRSE